MPMPMSLDAWPGARNKWGTRAGTPTGYTFRHNRAADAWSRQSQDSPIPDPPLQTTDGSADRWPDDRSTVPGAAVSDCRSSLDQAGNGHVSRLDANSALHRPTGQVTVFAQVSDLPKAAITAPEVG